MNIFNIFKKNKFINPTNKNQEIKKSYELLEKEKLINDNNESFNFEMKLYENKEESKCPYCKFEFEKDIQDEEICPSCNKIIKITNSYLDNEKRLFLKEDEYNNLVALRKRFEFYKKVSSNLYGYGVKKEEINLNASSPLEEALRLYDNILNKSSVKKKYDFLSLGYYQKSNIEKFLGTEAYIGSLFLSLYYDYLFDYDINFLMNEANIIKIGGFIEFIPKFLPAKIESLKESKKSIDELVEIFNNVVTEDRFKDNVLKEVISAITKEKEEEENENIDSI